MIAAEFDLAALELDFARFSAATGKGVAQVMEEQASLLTRDLIRVTAPMANFGSKSESLASQRRAGLAATERDIRKVFTAFEDLSIVKKAHDPKLAARLKKYEQAGNLQAVRTVLSTLEPAIEPSAVVPLADMKRLHFAQRNARGNVRRGARKIGERFFVTSSSLKKYIASRLKFVGTLKGGLAAAASRFKRSLPSWSHPISPGRVSARLAGDNPEITITNNVKYAGDERGRRLALMVLEWRRGEMLKQIAAKIRGEWGKSSRRRAA